MSDSVQPHRWPPTSLLCPWDSPGKHTGVGCHFLLQCMKVKSESEFTQSCPTLSDPMDCSPPGSSAHGIFQARVLEWGAISFSYQRVFEHSLALPFFGIGVKIDLFQSCGNGTSLQYSCLENPMGRGAWWAAVYGVAKSRTRLSDLTFTFHFHALEKAMATHCSVLAWRIPGTAEPGGLSSMGSQRVGHN